MSTDNADNEIINEFKKKYHMECHATPQTGQEDDDVDFMDPITPKLAII